MTCRDGGKYRGEKTEMVDIESIDLDALKFHNGGRQRKC
jgi:hypothetical protein